MADGVLLFRFRRWRVVLPRVAVKGMSEAEARRYADVHGGAAWLAAAVGAVVGGGRADRAGGDR